MTKNAFLFGMGLGIVLGTYLIKNCPAANRAYDCAENNIKQKASDIKEKVRQKKQSGDCCQQNQQDEEI